MYITQSCGTTLQCDMYYFEYIPQIERQWIYIYKDITSIPSGTQRIFISKSVSTYLSLSCRACLYSSGNKHGLICVCNEISVQININKIV